MIEEVELRPTHSVIFVGDPDEHSPDVDGVSIVNIAPCVVSVLTQAEVDGPTIVQLVDADDPVELPPHTAFEGLLELPQGLLTIADAAGTAYLERQLNRRDASLQIMVNEEFRPDRIVVRVLHSRPATDHLISEPLPIQNQL